MNAPQIVESLLLAIVRIDTFLGDTTLTNGTGFFFKRDERLFLVTSRHVLIDEASNHRPDAVRIDLHNNPENVVETKSFSIPLYRDGTSLWRQTEDSSGMIDVAALEIDRGALPDPLVYDMFTPEHLLADLGRVEVGASLLVVGFPLGFRDTLHQMPVARHAIVASSFGLRFQGNGYFLTDGRTHRGISGAPVVMHSGAGRGSLPWVLLGIHSARIDLGIRDAELDEPLGLNCAWYADVLLTLTDG